MSFFLGFIVALVLGCVFAVGNAARQDTVDGLGVASLGCKAIIAAFVLAGIAIALISSVR